MINWWLMSISKEIPSMFPYCCVLLVAIFKASLINKNRYKAKGQPCLTPLKTANHSVSLLLTLTEASTPKNNSWHMWMKVEGTPSARITSHRKDKLIVSYAFMKSNLSKIMSWFDSLAQIIVSWGTCTLSKIYRMGRKAVWSLLIMFANNGWSLYTKLFSRTKMCFIWRF